MSYISPTNTPMSFSNLKKNVKKYPINALATICNPHPPFHFYRPSSFEKRVHCFIVYVCLYLIQYMYMYQWFENQ